MSNNAKAIYKGPTHFWNWYTLNPREKYYYGYYGSYGPSVNPKYYKPLKLDNYIETFDNNNTPKLLPFIVAIALITATIAMK